jgi:hypothetical protein
MSTQAINLDDFNTIKSIFDKKDNDNAWSKVISNVDNEDSSNEPNAPTLDPNSVNKTEEAVDIPSKVSPTIYKETQGDVLDPQTYTNMFNFYKNK